MTPLSHHLLRAFLPAALLPLGFSALLLAFGAPAGLALLGAALLGAAVALGLAARQARWLGGSLEALGQAFGQAREGDRSPAPRPSSPAELAALTEAYNALLAALDVEVTDLAAERAQLETLLGQLPDGLLVLDGNGRIARFNPAAARLLRLGERAHGQTLIEAVPLYQLDALAREALRGAQPPPVEARAPWPPHAALRFFALPIQAEKGFGGVSILIQDLTDVRRLDELRRDFVANVSHELRTPVASLLALAETLLLRAEQRPEIVPEYAERLRQQAARLTALVEDLLRLSEIESGRRRLVPEPLPLAPLFAEVVETFRPAAAAKSIRLECDADDLHAQADAAALRQALGNLVDNALKYTPEGGTVRLAAVARDGQVVVSVRDTGIGIEPEALPRVFERFYRTDRGRSRAEGGTGLGLAIVRHLVEAQGGRLWAESEVGEGSCFCLALPPADGGTEGQSGAA